MIPLFFLEKNMKKPIIGIVARPDTIKTQRTCMQALERYRLAIVKCGGNPIIILPTQSVEYEKTETKDVPKLSDEEKDDLIAQIKLCDGILLPGGDRIFYYDLFITQYALDNDIPLFGICMGMQAMGIIDNDNYNCLVDVKDKKMHKIDMEGNCFHSIKIERDSILYSILEEDEYIVNSIHGKVLPYLNSAKSTAYSQNGEIEAMEFTSKRFAIGVQWHPELMVNNDEKMEKLFRNFIESAM